MKFQGICDTEWKEDNIHWGTFGSFFTEQITIIEHRVISEHLRYLSVCPAFPGSPL